MAELLHYLPAAQQRQQGRGCFAHWRPLHPTRHAACRPWPRRAAAAFIANLGLWARHYWRSWWAGCLGRRSGLHGAWRPHNTQQTPASELHAASPAQHNPSQAPCAPPPPARPPARPAPARAGTLWSTLPPFCWSPRCSCRPCCSCPWRESRRCCRGRAGSHTPPSSPPPRRRCARRSPPRPRQVRLAALRAGVRRPAVLILRSSGRSAFLFIPAEAAKGAGSIWPGCTIFGSATGTLCCNVVPRGG